MPDETLEKALPFGVDASTGTYLRENVPQEALNHIDEDPDNVKKVSATHAGVAVAEPNDLGSAGWAVLFPQNRDCTDLKQALSPLLDLRRSQAGALFKIFEGPEGVVPGDTAEKWLKRAPRRRELRIVNPLAGVPYYILLVGSPEEISFEFQYMLDTYWAVGRLHFETLDEYAAYAKHAVAAEQKQAAKTIGVFATRHLSDGPTQSLHDHLALPFVAGKTENGVQVPPLGKKQGMQVASVLAKDATKANLRKLLAGELDGGQPSLLFSGSHGVHFPMTDPDQAKKHGALLCQDLEQLGPPLQQEHYFSADDLGSLELAPMIHFLFACYGAGCPKNDTFDQLPGQGAQQLMPAPKVARLPQSLLTRGALAIIGHVDRAWTSSFIGANAAQTTDFEWVMTQLMLGQRVGQALDAFNQRWSVLSDGLSDLIEGRAIPGQVNDDTLIEKWKMRNDARNYVILGDPAARLNF